LYKDTWCDAPQGEGPFLISSTEAAVESTAKSVSEKHPGIGRSMETQVRWSSVWRVFAIAGICLSTIGVSSAYFDFFDLAVELASLWAGLPLAFVGLIGWTSFLRRGARARTAGLVFILPWAGYLLTDRVPFFYQGGSRTLVYVVMQRFLVLPVASALALVLLVMAGFGSKT
jgi:hypothetical protein